MKTHWILSALAVGALLPGPARAEDISFDFDRHADFSQFRTYAVEVNPTDNPLIDRRILENIEAQLRARGLERTTINPDVTVVARLQLDKSKRVRVYNTNYWPYGWGYGYGYGYASWPWAGDWGWGHSDVVVKDIVTGTMTIDMTNTATNTLVWRGIAVRKMSDDQEADDIDRRISRSVEKVFRHYPPDPDDLD